MKPEERMQAYLHDATPRDKPRINQAIQSHNVPSLLPAHATHDLRQNTATPLK